MLSKEATFDRWQDEPGRQSAANLLTRNEAPRGGELGQAARNWCVAPLKLQDRQSEGLLSSCR